MASRKVFVDKTEIVVMLAKSASSVVPFNYNDIQTIRVEPTLERNWFRKVPSERIVIKPKDGDTVIIKKSKHLEMFDTYKEEIEAFAKNHKLTYSSKV